MSNIYLKAEKKLTFSKLRFSKSSIIFSGSCFCALQITDISLNFLLHTFKPPSSSKREVCNKPSISRRWHHVCKFLDFSFFESLRNALFRAFCSPNISLESWILHCLRENFLKYSPDIAICTLIVYLNIH